MSRFTIAIIFIITASTYSFGQRDLKKTGDIIRIESNSNSRGQDIYISESSEELCNTSNPMNEEEVLISENSCLRIENLTKLTINIYLDGDFYSAIPPLGLLDGFVKYDERKSQVYAMASFDDGSTKSWGPWEHASMSCSMFLLE